MRLVIVRHGKAERESSTGRDDERLLTRKGERQSEFLGRSFADDGAPPDLILSSGVLRAIQTARIIRRSIPDASIRVEAPLESGEPVSAAVELIMRARARLLTRPGLMVVGHNPQLEGLLGLLVNGQGAPSLPLRTGEAAVLESPDDAGALIIGACPLVERRRLDDGED
jgi:phosphohistidine phosphatase